MSNIFRYRKRNTDEIKIGKLPMGGAQPVRTQSMTNTDTNDVDPTLSQIISIYQAGADMVRITVPTMKSVRSAAIIKEKLTEKGYVIPLIADIHFSPKVALASAEIFDKIRINPGNYIDKKEFKHIAYTDEEYRQAVEAIKRTFAPLLQVCRKHKTAMRIGTNHGSLSDRILSRYGDTPEGMVESTMEFLRICKDENFAEIVISMKASNPRVMIEATRLLAQKMQEEEMFYCIHLGVTEAGNEDDGRIKSAVGIGSLLADGIGDTVRVSLTETPENEIPVAKILCDLFAPEKMQKYQPEESLFSRIKDFSLQKNPRKTFACGIVGGGRPAVVIADFFNGETKSNPPEADFIFSTQKITSGTSSGILLHPDEKNGEFLGKADGYSYCFQEFLIENIARTDFEALKKFRGILILNLSASLSPVHDGRCFFALLARYGLQNPVILKMQLPDVSWQSKLKVAAEFGSLFVDGLGEGVWLQSTSPAPAVLRSLSFTLLQACRLRISKPDYISCPSCGRTLFNLEEVTAEIKARTAHLTGVKIGIMGCIVNGPGEMADADFGYVGSGPGKITLYKNKEAVKRNIPENQAVEELLKLIEAERG